MDFPKLLLVGVLERACRKTIIREIPGISDCFILKDQPKAKQGEPPIDYTVVNPLLPTAFYFIHCYFTKLMTNGSNLRGMWSKTLQENPIVQINNIYTNDIYAMLTHYGVEGARTVLIKEISSVFGSYNIDVDFRHLELIADYMVSTVCPSSISVDNMSRPTTEDTKLSTEVALHQIALRSSKHRTKRRHRSFAMPPYMATSIPSLLLLVVLS
jgi:RNA polymerase Rpb1, domain 5